MHTTNDLVTPRAVTFARILEAVGPPVLTVAAGRPHLDDTIDQILFYDEVDALPPCALPLGIGLNDPAHTTRAVERLARAGLGSLVVRGPLQPDAQLSQAIDRYDFCLLQLGIGASWGQLAASLKALFINDDTAPDESSTIGSLPAGDLFAAANAVRALVNAPITIEDLNSQVVAFSVGQEDTDVWRVETILGRQVPRHQLAVLDRIGFLKDLYASRRPRYLDLRSVDGLAAIRPRVAIAVRTGHEVLGSIWAIVDGPLSPEHERFFTDSANLVAGHLLRLRAGADIERRSRTASVTTALSGGVDAGSALGRLGLTGDALGVVALGLRTPAVANSEGNIADSEAAMEIAADRLSGFLAAVSSRAAAAAIEGCVYAIVPLSPGTPDGLTAIVRLAEQFLDWIGDGAFIAIGREAHECEGLYRSRLEADQILDVLRRSAGARRVARLDDVRADVLLADLASGDTYPSPAVQRLIEYDRKHRSQLVETLRAWLNAHGDNIAAAATVHVHPNTFRYRLRRILQVGEVDLRDPDARFAADLHLRILSFREDRSDGHE